MRHITVMFSKEDLEDLSSVLSLELAVINRTGKESSFYKSLDQLVIKHLETLKTLINSYSDHKNLGPYKFQVDDIKVLSDLYSDNVLWDFTNREVAAMLKDLLAGISDIDNLDLGQVSEDLGCPECGTLEADELMILDGASEEALALPGVDLKEECYCFKCSRSYTPKG